MRAAIEEAMTQQQSSWRALGRALGIEHTTLTRGLGADQMTLGRVRAIENALGLTHGWLLIRAGYVEDVSSIESAIAGDTTLEEVDREILSRTYRRFAAARPPRRRRER